jgi:hypothetical protein
MRSTCLPHEALKYEPTCSRQRGANREYDGQTKFAFKYRNRINSLNWRRLRRNEEEEDLTGDRASEKKKQIFDNLNFGALTTKG